MRRNNTKVKTPLSNRSLPIFLIFLLILGSIPLGQMVAGSTQGPIYLNGDQVTIKVFPTGGFTVNPMDFPSRLSDMASSFWSFNVDGKVTTTYNPLTVDKVVTPPKKMADGTIKVQYLLQNEVLVDLTYRQAGPAAWITITIINVGTNHHTVGVRHLYDLNGKNLAPAGQSPVTTEIAFVSPIFDQVDIFEGATRKGTVSIAGSLGLTQPSKMIFGSWDKTWTTDWTYTANTSASIGSQPTLLVYWENMDLPAKSSVRIEHSFGSNVPSHTAKSVDLVIDKVTATPQDQYLGKKRTITATVRNVGPAVDNVDIDFFIVDSNGNLATNGSVVHSFALGETFDIAWTYDVKKLVEAQAFAVVDPSQDAAAYDNYGKSSIVAHPSPYKVGLKFADGTKNNYISINSGQNAVSNVIVTNLGSIEDNITLSLTTLAPGWNANFSQAYLTMNAGASSQVKLVIKTVKDLNYYNFRVDVKARSVGNGATDTVVLFISFADIIAKSGGNINVTGNTTNPDPNPNPGTNNTHTIITDPNDNGVSLTTSQVAVIFVMFGVAFVSAVAIYQIYLVQSKRGMKNILKDFYKKLYDANTSDAYRKAIYNAYKQMCEEIARYGHERSESITPKEFERHIREYLPVDRKNLHILTKLFEEARYSDHSFNEAKKKQALAALEGIINSLEAVTTFEEVKESRWSKKNN
jgi:hypothetical protein